MQRMLSLIATRLLRWITNLESTNLTNQKPDIVHWRQMSAEYSHS
jgi:hypothetical protein